MKKCIIAILLAMPMAMAGGVWASDGAAEPAPAPGLAVTEALPSVTGLWRMSDTETVCFVAGGTLRFVGPGWRQNGNYSCTAMHCTVTLLAVPNQPASQNQWNLWLSGTKDDLKLEGADKKNFPVKLLKIKDSCS